MCRKYKKHVKKVLTILVPFDIINKLSRMSDNKELRKDEKSS